VAIIHEQFLPRYPLWTRPLRSGLQIDELNMLLALGQFTNDGIERRTTAVTGVELCGLFEIRLSSIALA